MEGRPLLKNTKKVRIHIDSESFEELLNESNEIIHTILSYHRSEYFNFVRSPLESAHDELLKIYEYKLVLDEVSDISGIEIKTNSQRISSHFGYKENDIRRIAQKVYQKDGVNDSEYFQVVKVFVQAIFNHQESGYYSTRLRSRYERYEGFEEINIYITNNEIILKNRLWFENHFPGYPLNIVTAEEASCLMGLFLINNDLFCNSYTSYPKWMWYWFSMRLKIPHFNVGETFIDALVNRFSYSLMAVDEIGKQYYLGVDNSTMETKIYHFNYLISLITGIFDNLALHTNDCLEINETNNFKITLSPSRSKGSFLKSVQDKNPELYEHIQNHNYLVKLLFLLRNPIMHREGVSSTSFRHRDDEVQWEASFIVISEEVNNVIKNCGDSPRDYDPFSKWGTYQQYDRYFLEPYHFSIQAITEVAYFVDKYLQILGNPSVMDDEGFTMKKTLEPFKYYKLGF